MIVFLRASPPRFRGLPRCTPPGLRQLGEPSMDVLRPTLSFGVDRDIRPTPVCILAREEELSSQYFIVGT